MRDPNLTTMSLVETKALVLYGPTEFVYETVAIPGPLKSQDVLVKMVATSLCHTDIHVRNELLFNAPYPRILGHEGAGTIEAVGDGISTLKKGDRVVLSATRCSQCVQCKAGDGGHCHSYFDLNTGTGRADGSAVFLSVDAGKPISGQFFGQSSFAQYSIVSEHSVIKVPSELDNLKLENLGPFGCGLLTGAGAVMNVIRPHQHHPTESIVVFGIGAVGFSALLAAKICKIKQIIAVDLVQSRLDLAKDLGAATHIVNGRETKDIVSEIKKLTGDKGVDAAFDTTGSSRVINDMIESLGISGKAVSVAGDIGQKVEIDVGLFFIKGLQYCGAIQGQCITQEVISWKTYAIRLTI